MSNRSSSGMNRTVVEKHNPAKRITVWVLILAMLISSIPGIPLASFAASSGSTIDMSHTSPPAAGTGWTYANGVYTILDGADVTIIGHNGSSGRRIEVADDAYVKLKLNGATIYTTNTNNAAIYIGVGATATIVTSKDTGTNQVYSGGSRAGIEVPTGATLNLGGDGYVRATGGMAAAGIGAAYEGSCGKISVFGGTVSVYGGEDKVIEGWKPAPGLATILEKAGFLYDPAGDVLFSRKDADQYQLGYSYFYDEGIPLVSSNITAEPIYFYYDNKEWLIEIWKGQYGVETGAEIGVYNRPLNGDLFKNRINENYPGLVNSIFDFVGDVTGIPDEVYELLRQAARATNFSMFESALENALAAAGWLKWNLGVPISKLEQAILIVLVGVNGKLYDVVREDEMLRMSYTLRDGDKELFTRKSWETYDSTTDKHWWLTGFQWGNYTNTPHDLTMEVTIWFPTNNMRQMFLFGVHATQGVNTNMTNAQIQAFRDKDKAVLDTWSSWTSNAVGTLAYTGSSEFVQSTRSERGLLEMGYRQRGSYGAYTDTFPHTVTVGPGEYAQIADMDRNNQPVYYLDPEGNKGRGDQYGYPVKFVVEKPKAKQPVFNGWAEGKVNSANKSIVDQYNELKAQVNCTSNDPNELEANVKNSGNNDIKNKYNDLVGKIESVVSPAFNVAKAAMKPASNYWPRTKSSDTIIESIGFGGDQGEIVYHGGTLIVYGGIVADKNKFSKTTTEVVWWRNLNRSDENATHGAFIHKTGEEDNLKLYKYVRIEAANKALPAIRVNPAVIDFGTVAPGYSAISSKLVFVYNEGGAATELLTNSLGIFGSLNSTKMNAGASVMSNVRPPTGLNGGDYTQTFIIETKDGISVPFTIKFAVYADADDFYAQVASYAAATEDMTITLTKDLDLYKKVLVPDNPHGKTLTIKGGGNTIRTLKRGASNETKNVTFFTIDPGAKLILENVIIDGDSSSGQTTPGLVQVEGDLTMTNARLINGNVTNAYGGGAYVGSSATLTMNNGAEISDNRTSVYNNKGGVAGGVYVDSNGTFIMNSGSAVIANTSTATDYSNGGGVCLAPSATFIMESGARVANNHVSSEDGSFGVLVGESATFTMNGGEISGNTGRSSDVNSGGGVRVNGSFFMNGGIIYGHNADIGGGVYVSKDCTFIMTGGEISGNTASDYVTRGGGGVYYAGGGQARGTLKLGGTAVIRGNKLESGVDSNLDASTSQGGFITIGTGGDIPEPDTGMEIWIGPKLKNDLIISTGFKPEYLAYFGTDAIGREVQYLNNNGGQLVITTPADEATYIASSVPSSVTFPELAEGYKNTSFNLTQLLTIWSIGSSWLTNVTAEIVDGTDFEISVPLSHALLGPSTCSSLTNKSATVTVRPVSGLAARATPYTATLRISGDNGLKTDIPLSFTVADQHFGGDGTIENPYQIRTVEELEQVRSYLDSSFILMNDIDLTAHINENYSSSGWLPIGGYSSDNSPSFSGTFDGNWHRILGVWIDRPSTYNIGFFGSTSGASISNLGIEVAAHKKVSGSYRVGGLVGLCVNTSIINCYASGNVSGTSDYVGGLVGYISDAANITASYATGAVSGWDYVGGLVGRANGSSITASYATGAVSGQQNVGGLIGRADGSVTDCYATGAVSGRIYIGGFVGTAYGSVSDCYATGAVSGTDYVGSLVGGTYSTASVKDCYANGKVTGEANVGGLVGSNWPGALITNSFFDIETTGQTGGKTTAEMKLRSTYTAWDFSTVWGIASVENNGYPYLQWTRPVYNVSIDPADHVDFGSATVGYEAQTPHSVTITNTGDRQTYDIKVDISGANPDSFTLSAETISSIAEGGSDAFTVVPKIGLQAGTYTASVTIACWGFNARKFDVSFRVKGVGSTHTVTVSGEGTGASGGGEYYETEIVSISAGTAQNGMQFSHWTASPAVVFSDANRADTTFTMPDENVTVKAIFKAIINKVESVYYGGSPYSVMENDGTTMTLFMNGNIGNREFDSSSHKYWSGSDTCLYLNNAADGFLSTLTAVEQAAIPLYGTTETGQFQTININQKIVLPSVDEVQDNGTWGLNSIARSHRDEWWLRSPGNSDHATLVSTAGFVLTPGDNVSRRYAIRPVFRLNLTSVLLISDTVGGKSSAAAGGDLVSVTTPKSTVKFTLLDNKLALATATRTSISGQTVNFNYTGATTGKTLSAVVFNSSGAVIYYGKLVDKITTASGSASVNIPSDFKATDTMKIFVEEVNGDYLTDYASTPVDIAVPAFKPYPASVIGFGGKLWDVIGYDGDGVVSDVDVATLLLKNGQNYDDITEFHSSSNAYSGSTLKSKMEEAANSVANPKEKMLIVPTNLTGGAANNAQDGMHGANVDNALFWPLSVSEALQVNGTVRNYFTWWWLRSPGYINNMAAFVLHNGIVNDHGGGNTMNTTFLAIRPAFKLNLASVLFTSDAAGGKSSVVADGILIPMQPGGANLKFTILDNTLKLGSVDSIGMNGSTVRIAYAGATARKTLSAVVLDSSGEVKYYGKLLASTGTSGTAEVTLPVGFDNATDTLKIFVEEANGDNYTDFASGYMDLTVPKPYPISVIGFGGKLWDVIGYDGVGVASDADVATLLLKNGQSYGVSPFRGSGNAYSGSTLQSTMEEAANSVTNPKEKKLIVPTNLTGGAANNAQDGMHGANVDNALFWPLSVSEANQVNNTVRTFSGHWWLRSPGNSNIYAELVNGDGSVYANNYHVYYAYNLRPALKLNLTSVLFTSDAEGGKSSAIVEGGLIGVTSPTGAVKYTMLDGAINTPALGLAGVTNGTSNIGFSFSSATAGTNQYTSCILEQSGEIKYYGKLADCATTTSGNFTIPVSGLANGTYSLKIFGEQANDDNYTDFAGASNKMTLTVTNGNGVISDFSGDSMLEGTVAISGSAVYGETLTAVPAISSTAPGTLTYQWKRGTTDIGANSDTYTLTTADIGAAITVTVSTANYEGSLTSAPTAAVSKAPAPTITFPTSTAIAYGAALSTSALSGGSTEYGTFAWTNGSVIPTVVNSGYEVTFTPSADTVANYEAISTLTGTVAITVNCTVHEWDEGVVTKEPTETEEGERVYTCIRCGESRTEPIPVLSHSHNYTAAITLPTCIEQGYTTFTCTCGDSYVGDYVPVLGHVEVDQSVAATCEIAGYTKTVCSTCGETLKYEDIPALGHVEIDQSVAAACEIAGYTKTVCSTCGETLKYEDIPALGHVEVDQSVAATCEIAGYTRIVCSTCGETLKYEDIPALGHVEVDQSVAATCETAGYTKIICAICGETLKYEVVPVLDHVEEDQSLAATHDTAGYTKIVCSLCGKILFYEDIAPLSYTVQFIGLDGKTILATQIIANGGFIDPAKIPEVDCGPGREVKGWRLQESINGDPYALDIPVTGNLKLMPIPGDIFYLRVKTDAHMVQVGGYFNVMPHFIEELKSNTAALTFTFDDTKFEYRGFFPAEGVTVLKTVVKDGSVQIVVMVADYKATEFGKMQFSARDAADLKNEDNEIQVAAQYVVLLEDGTKVVKSEVASTLFTTWIGEDGPVTLIMLSNLIDVFGMTNDDPKWLSYRFYDYNNNKKIDIHDIGVLASRIKI